jgi:putative tricarboxylic transport membrane protein
MVAGAMVPSLVLGIPGSGSAAIVLGMLISKGVVPSPQLFTEQGGFVMTIFIGLIVGHVFMLAIGLLGARCWGCVTRVPARLLGPFVMLLLVIGTYAYHEEIADVGMVLVFGLVGYVFEKLEIPLVPIVLAFVMGPIIEQNLNRSLTISAGNLGALLLQPITLAILVLAIVTAVYGFAGGGRHGTGRAARAPAH